MKSGHLDRQVGIGFGQLLNLTGNTLKLAYLVLLGVYIPIEGMDSLLVHLQLVCPLSQTSPQTFDNCLLGNAPNLQGLHPH